MSVFDHPDFDDHETISFHTDPETGLRCLIAIHTSGRGRALGGCRYWAYADDTAAIADVLRLSRGMTYKSAMAGLPHGGGKSVIMADPDHPKTAAMMRAFGRIVEGFGGRYLVAEDVGTSPADMAEVATQTRHVAGLRDRGGDPSAATALGVLHGLRAAVRHRLGRGDLDGLRVAVQGLGHVGWHLCQRLTDAGARLMVSDLRADLVVAAKSAFDAQPLAPEAILNAPVDVLAPCALGAVINDATVEMINAPVIAGSANNQLATDAHGDRLAARGILFAPDYVINAGGLINVHHELSGAYDHDAAMAHVGRIEQTVEAVFARAARDHSPPHRAADAMARERIKQWTTTPA